MIAAYDPWNWQVFLFVVLGILALALIVLGILTSYFGSGKSRIVGVSLLVVGIVIGLIIFLVTDYYMTSVGLLNNVIVGAFFYILATAIGAAIALLVFLGAIMKT